MRFTVSQEELTQALTRAQAIADRKSSMPILAHVLLQAKEGYLHLCATDLTLQVTSTLKASIEEEGQLTLPARTLFDVVKNLPSAAVELASVDDAQVEVRAGKSRYRLAYLKGDDYPELPQADEAKECTMNVESQRLLSVLSKVHISMTQDSSRPHLAGALLEIHKDRLRMVSIDGHRLTCVESLGDTPQALDPLLLPAKGVHELRRLLEDKLIAGDDTQVRVMINRPYFFLQRGSVILGIKLIQDGFPPYAQVIPQSHQRQAVVSRQALVDALRRVRVLMQDKSRPVRFCFESASLQLTSESPEVGDAYEEIEASYEGETLMIGLNAGYVLDALGVLEDEEITLQLSGDLDPSVIRPATQGQEDSFVGVIMPIRV